jgi:hypothetical protein
LNAVLGSLLPTNYATRSIAEPMNRSAILNEFESQIGLALTSSGCDLQQRGASGTAIHFVGRQAE